MGWPRRRPCRAVALAQASMGVVVGGVPNESMNLGASIGPLQHSGTVETYLPDPTMQNHVLRGSTEKSL